MHDKSLVEMLEAEITVKRQLIDPQISEVRVPHQFYNEQLGLSGVLAGPDGRLWMQHPEDNRSLKLVAQVQFEAAEKLRKQP